MLNTVANDSNVETEAVPDLKQYHTPQMVVLGPVHSLVLAEGGVSGDDLNPCFTSVGS